MSIIFFNKIYDSKNMNFLKTIMKKPLTHHLNNTPPTVPLNKELLSWNFNWIKCH